MAVGCGLGRSNVLRWVTRGRNPAPDERSQYSMIRQSNRGHSNPDWLVLFPSLTELIPGTNLKFRRGVGRSELSTRMIPRSHQGDGDLPRLSTADMCFFIAYLLILTCSCCEPLKNPGCCGYIPIHGHTERFVPSSPPLLKVSRGFVHTTPQLAGEPSQ